MKELLVCNTRNRQNQPDIPYSKKHIRRHKKMDGTEIRKKFPQFTTDENTVGVYDETSGFVDAALANGVHTQLARSHGAIIIENCTVTSISRDSSGRINVDATKGNFQCRRLVVTAGAWTSDVLNKIGVHIPITVTQEQVTYLGTPNIKDFTKDRFPVWFYFNKDGLFYGFPIHGNTGTKVALDTRGQRVTAQSRTFIPDKNKEEICIDFLKKICPKALGPILYTKTCLYAVTPDRHFVVDNCQHAGWPDVMVCAGSGHIYKFASLMGKILSELAIDGKTEYDLSTFSITREAITDPTFNRLKQLYRD